MDIIIDEAIDETMDETFFQQKKSNRPNKEQRKCIEP